jgi:hypothetical protein
VVESLVLVANQCNSSGSTRCRLKVAAASPFEKIGEEAARIASQRVQLV